MTPKERKAWLAALKVGDEVAVVKNDREDLAGIRRLESVSQYGFSWRGSQTEQITGVGPNGRIANQYGKARIEPVTDAIREREADRARLGRLRAIDWGKVSPEVRRVVCALLDTGKPIVDHAFAGSGEHCGYPLDHAGPASLEYPDGEPTEATSEVCGRTHEEHAR